MATKKKTSKRKQNPKRYRKAKATAAVPSIERRIERDFGLPKGSVKLVYPSGRKARRDATMESLRKHWTRKG
jgi:hypothetical protein